MRGELRLWLSVSKHCFSLSTSLSLPCKGNLQVHQFPSSTAMAPEQSPMRIRPTIKSARSTLHLLPQFSTTADKTTINPLNLSDSHFPRLLLRAKRSQFTPYLFSPLSASSYFTSSRTVLRSQVYIPNSSHRNNRQYTRSLVSF